MLMGRWALELTSRLAWDSTGSLLTVYPDRRFLWKRFERVRLAKLDSDYSLSAANFLLLRLIR